MRNELWRLRPWASGAGWQNLHLTVSKTKEMSLINLPQIQDPSPLKAPSFPVPFLPVNCQVINEFNCHSAYHWRSIVSKRSWHLLVALQVPYALSPWHPVKLASLL